MGKAVVKFTLSNSDVGKIMGKGGAKISAIRTESGAVVGLSETEMDMRWLNEKEVEHNKHTERLVTIQGTPEQVRRTTTANENCITFETV